MKESKLKTITINYRVDLEFDVRHIPSDVLDAMCESEDNSDTWGSDVDKDNELAMKAQIASEAIRWADAHPRKVYVVVRCEEHDDYVEKVFVDKTKANEYCNKFEGNPNEYGRYYKEMEVTL